MIEVVARPAGLQHVVFLERAVHDAGALPAGFGKAAFLVLRLVDLVNGHRPSRNELFGYQAAATGRYCNEHLEPDPCSDLLLELVRIATYAHRREDPGLLAPGMIALAQGLEDMACYEEALDVLATLERVAGMHLRPADAVTTVLRIARLERKVGRFDLAEVAYARARDLATATHNREGLLRSRLGRANVLRLRGNLADAQQATEQALADARTAGERQMEAEAEHHLGVVLGTRGELNESVLHFWRAFELYGSGTLALFALHDLGVTLSRLGATSDAERALRHVVAHSEDRSNMQNAMIELMQCASFRRDRVGFERCRTYCAKEQAVMSPNILADYLLKLGIGLARFGQFDRAESELTLALQVAQAHQLHEFEFRIERIRAGLGDCAGLDIVETDAVTESPTREALGAVSTALTALPGDDAL